MKRVGNLIEPIANMDNLRLAFYKAQRGKAFRPAIISYRRNLEANLLKLRKQILDGQPEVGDYTYFKIFDPKERLICSAAFGERVLHHALMNVCHPYFERVQIYDSYASRFGKGTYAALDRAAHFTKRYPWFLKLDVRKYFASIHHEVAQQQVARLFKDARLLTLFQAIIASYEASPQRGLPIGNLTSQYLANHYLAAADHFAREKLNVPGYVRYMDDMVLWHPNKSSLLTIGRQFDAFTTTTLQLTLKPPCLNHSERGVPFLGYLVYPQQLRLAHRSRIRFIQKLNRYTQAYAESEWNEADYQRHVLPLIAFTEKAQSRGFRMSVLRAMGEWYEPGHAWPGDPGW